MVGIRLKSHFAGSRVRRGRGLRCIAHRASCSFTSAGFTLIELLVVMAIIAVLLTLAVPYYFGSLQKSRDAVLRENLELVRQALDKHYGDSGRYPDHLDDLVNKRYLRRIPRDPITESATTWVSIPPEDPAQGGVYDIKSGADGKGADGTAYEEW